jgi:hypothetical protein
VISLKVTIAVVTTMTLLAGCGKNATYQQRIDYLHQVALRGAETHNLVASQDVVTDRARCERAYAGLNTNDAPEVDGDAAPGGNSAHGWQSQIEEFFVDSCVSGKPKPAPGDTTPVPTGTSRGASGSPTAPLPSTSG